MQIEDLRKGLQLARYYVQTGDSSGTGYSEQELSRYLTVRRYDKLTLLNYTNLAQYHAQWNPFLRVCRGLVIDTNGQIVSFPFHKFFNINEQPETHILEVSQWEFRSVTEKVDGVMIQVFRHEGKPVFASRHGIWTPSSILASELAKDIDCLVSSFDFPFTLICELVHPKVWQPGMIHYGADVELLVPLFVRNLDTLELIPAHELLGDLPPRYRFPEQYRYRDIQSLVDDAGKHESHQWEGAVVQGAGERGNRLVKVKSLGYIRRLQLVRGLSPNRILQIYRQQGMDGVRDAIASVEEIVLTVPTIRSVIEALEHEESRLREEIRRYMLPRDRVMEVPQEWRWVVSYQGTGKMDTAIRKRVSGIVDRLFEDSKRNANDAEYNDIEVSHEG